MLLAPYPMTSYIPALWRSWLGEVRVPWRSPYYGIRGFILANVRLTGEPTSGLEPLTSSHYENVPTRSTPYESVRPTGSLAGIFDHP
jgi:hypothetical protein